MIAHGGLTTAIEALKCDLLEFAVDCLHALAVEAHPPAALAALQAWVC
jgi:hypothetical protein